VQAYDPAAHDAIEGVELHADAYAACEGADVLAVLTEWDEFRWVEFAKVREAMARPAIVDCRNLLDPTAVRRHGFSYEGLGRP
jgi:UDPglucose 6-dehydrogenase